MKGFKKTLLSVVILTVFIAAIFFVKLLVNPDVTVGERDPFSWENIKDTALVLLGALVVVLLVKTILIDEKHGESSEDK